MSKTRSIGVNPIKLLSWFVIKALWEKRRSAVVFNFNNMSDYNIQLVRRFRKAEKEFQDSDMFLLGLFELASGHAAIKSQENTVNDICDYLTGHVFKNVKGEQIHGGFITECIKKDLEYE